MSHDIPTGCRVFGDNRMSPRENIYMTQCPHKETVKHQNINRAESKAIKRVAWITSVDDMFHKRSCKYRNLLFRKMFVGGVDPLSRSEEKPHRSTRLMGSKPDT